MVRPGRFLVTAEVPLDQAIDEDREVGNFLVDPGATRFRLRLRTVHALLRIGLSGFQFEMRPVDLDDLFACQLQITFNSFESFPNFFFHSLAPIARGIRWPHYNVCNYQKIRISVRPLIKYAA